MRDISNLDLDIIEGLKREVDTLNNKDFPIKVYPTQIQDIINQTCSNTTLIQRFVCTSILFTSSVCIGNKYQLYAGESFYAKANIFLVCVAYAGVGKTHPFSVFTSNYLDGIERRLYKDYKRDLKLYESNPNELEEKPNQVSILSGDTTLPTLKNDLSLSPQGMCIFNDELRTLFQSWYRFSKGSASDETEYLQLFDGRSQRVKRGRGDILEYIEKPFLSIGGTIQPNVLRSCITPDMKHNGFLERVLFVDGEEIEKPLPKLIYCDESKEVNASINSDIERYYNALLDYDGIRSFDCSQTKTIDLSRGASELWYNERVELTNRQRENKTNVLGSMCSKKEVKILKFALILNRLDHVCSMDTESNKEVTKDQMKRAIILSNWFFEQELTQRYKLGHLQKEQSYKDWQVQILSILTRSNKTAKDVYLSLKDDGIDISERSVREFLKSEEKEGGIKALGKDKKAVIYGV